MQANSYGGHQSAPHLGHRVHGGAEEVISDHVSAHNAPYDGSAVQANAHDDRRAVRCSKSGAQLLHVEGHAGEAERILLKRSPIVGHAARGRDEGVAGGAAGRGGENKY